MFIGLLAASIQMNGIGWDYRIYMDRAADFMAGRGFYCRASWQGHTSSRMATLSILPRRAALRAVPVPASLLYWVIPLAITAAVVVWHRPAIWAWPIIAAIPVLERDLMSDIHQRQSRYLDLAALSLATIWPAVAPLTALKWGLTPFALFGIWRREWWVGAGLALAICPAFAPMWPDYIRVVQDARGNSLDYILNEYPMMLIPLVAWGARTRHRRAHLPSVARPRAPMTTSVRSANRGRERMSHSD